MLEWGALQGLGRGRAWNALQGLGGLLGLECTTEVRGPIGVACRTNSIGVHDCVAGQGGGPAGVWVAPKELKFAVGAGMHRRAWGVPNWLGGTARVWGEEQGQWGSRSGRGAGGGGQRPSQIVIAQTDETLLVFDKGLPQ